MKKIPIICIFSAVIGVVYTFMGYIGINSATPESQDVVFLLVGITAIFILLATLIYYLIAPRGKRRRSGSGRGRSGSGSVSGATGSSFWHSHGSDSDGWFGGGDSGGGGGDSGGGGDGGGSD